VNQVQIGFGFRSVEIWVRSTSSEAHLDGVWVRIGSKSVSAGFEYGFGSILGRVEIESD